MVAFTGAVIEQQLALGDDDKDQELLALRQQLGSVLDELLTAKEAHADKALEAMLSPEMIS